MTRDEMFRRYEKQILPKHDEELAEIMTGIARPGYAILCYEADASDCHRRFVADEIQRRQRRRVDVVDLKIPKPKSALR